MTANREKRTVSGPLVEIDLYPVFSDGRRPPERSPKSKPTSEQMQKYNRRQATKKLVRKVNANFNKTDYYMHPTYESTKAPQSEKEARRDLVNYLRRVKTARAAALKEAKAQVKDAKTALKAAPKNRFLQAQTEELKKRIKKLSGPLKYVYAIEEETYKTGERAGRSNWHFHLFISGGLPAEKMEALWTAGVRVNCNRYNPDRFGPKAAAQYMAKAPQGSKRFVCSRGLKEPTVTTRDGVCSMRQMEKIARLRTDDAAWWERRYPGCRLLETGCRWNEYNGHWYISAVLYKTDGSPPSWNAGDWTKTETGS